MSQYVFMTFRLGQGHFILYILLLFFSYISFQPHSRGRRGTTIASTVFFASFWYSCTGPSIYLTFKYSWCYDFFDALSMLCLVKFWSPKRYSIKANSTTKELDRTLICEQWYSHWVQNLNVVLWYIIKCYSLHKINGISQTNIKTDGKSFAQTEKLPSRNDTNSFKWNYSHGNVENSINSRNASQYSVCNIFFLQFRI
jgi:hypothetical protein